MYRNMLVLYMHEAYVFSLSEIISSERIYTFHLLLNALPTLATLVRDVGIASTAPDKEKLCNI